MNTLYDLEFSPNFDELVPTEASGVRVIFTGSNNSGKSAYLKSLIYNPKRLYIGVSRFYSFHHLPFSSQSPEVHDSWYTNVKASINNSQQNFEHSFFDCSHTISSLTNPRRKILLETFENLFGIEASVLPEDPDNDFSRKFISIGGTSLGVTSSGTRLFLGILAALISERFNSIMIDEPELGLSPALQKKLADIIIRGERATELFPHNPNIILSTHSHLFLDRKNPTNNYVVQKNKNLITAKQCESLQELHDIQFRLLGNDLSELFLPDAVLFVEGETDKLFIEKLLKYHCPSLKVVIQACSGDIATRLSYWANTLGDMQTSPYRNRTFVIFDSVKQSGIDRACSNAGLPSQSRIQWERNGIEYLYPTSILSEIYRVPNLKPDDLKIFNDDVRVNDISYKKSLLCQMVVDKVEKATDLDTEITEKLISPLQQLSIS